MNDIYFHLRIAPGVLCMFTIAKAEELFLPIYTDVIDSFYCFKYKSSNGFDWANQISISLRNMGLSSTSYSDQIKGFNRLRQDCFSGAGPQHAICLGYFLQLEDLSVRLSLKTLDEDLFTWNCSLSPTTFQSQPALAFEKANVMFQAATYLANSNLSEFKVDEARQYYRQLIAAATIYDHIAQSFADPPFVDLDPALCSTYSKICLLYAQQLAFFVSISEKKSIKTLAKISIGIMLMLNEVLHLVSAMGVEELKELYVSLCQNLKTQNLIHVLLIAEFWSLEDRPDVAITLSKSFDSVLGSAQVRDKSSLQEYMTITKLRLEKEINHSILNETNEPILEPFHVAEKGNIKMVLQELVPEKAEFFLPSIYPIEVIKAYSIYSNRITEKYAKYVDFGEKIMLRFQTLNSLRQNVSVVLKDEIRNCIFKNEMAPRLKNFEENIRNMQLKLYRSSNSLESNIQKSLSKDFSELLEDDWYKKLKLIENSKIFDQMLAPFATRIALKMDDFAKNISPNIHDKLELYQAELTSTRAHFMATDINAQLLASQEKAKIVEEIVSEFENNLLQIYEKIKNIPKELNDFSATWTDQIQTNVDHFLHPMPELRELKPNLDKAEEKIAYIFSATQQMLSQEQLTRNESAKNMQEVLQTLLRKY